VNLVALLAVGALSWALRVLPVNLASIDRLPDRHRRILGYAAPAALAAMVATEVAGGDGASRVPTLLATLVAGVVAWRTGRLGLTVVAGIGSLWVVQTLTLG
jgi:branched-subunit amino acid transport protein